MRKGAVEWLREKAKRHRTLKAALFPAIVLRRRVLQFKANVQEEVVRNLARLLVEDPILKVPEFQGAFLLDRRSHLFRRIVINGTYEPNLARVCSELVDPERDVIDVGANVGFFSVLLAKQLTTGRVLAIEPTSNALGRLHRNITLNNVEAKVMVFEGVASSFIGTLQIKTIPGLEEYSSIGEMEHPRIIGSEYVLERVKSSTIDELVADHALNPGIVKIDVEGSENTVLEGARDTLRHKRPIVIAELSDFLLRKNGSSATEVLELFQSCDYDVTNVRYPGIPVGHEHFEDILCVPRHRSAR